jgi:uncharacterized membrane protein
MNTKKFLIGGLVGGIVYFFLGYLFYGNLFADFFAKNAGSATGVARPMDQFVWWSLTLGNILSGCLLSYVFVKSKISSVGSGMLTGAVIGLLTAASYNLTMYATSNLMNTTSLIGDVAIFAVMSAISGAVVAWVFGLIGKAKV